MTSVLEQTVVIHPEVINGIRLHSQQEDAKGGYEAVGFIAATVRSDVAVARMPLHNHAADPMVTFFVEPWEQFRAEKKLLNQGYRVVGVYHSHPTAEALPSGSDQKMARPGELMLIYSVVFDEMRAYREQDGHLNPVRVVEMEE